jgi:asparagine synthase (glutamine-hydrolysing)
MAYSLEARSPLLDHEFMEWAASLPPAVKVSGRRTKVGLRTALRGWVPDEVLDAPKQGFRPPVSDWLRSELREWSREVLLDPATIDRGYFREAEVRALLDRHAARTRDESRGIWSLLMFELWHRDVVEAPVPPAPPIDAGAAEHALPAA